MLKKDLKEQKGIMISDAMISILILFIFAGLVVSLMYNIVENSAKIKISSKHMELATEIFEYAEKQDYEYVIADRLIEYINNKNLDYLSAGTTLENLTTKYKIAIEVTPYNEIEGNEEKYDLVKIIKLKIQSNLENLNYYTEITTLKKATMEEAEQIINNN